VTEIEGLGVVWAVASLRPYIEGTRFLVRCDHKPSKWILTTTTCTNNRLNRWQIRLPEFDYDVVDNMPSRMHYPACRRRVCTLLQSPKTSRWSG